MTNKTSKTLGTPERAQYETKFFFFFFTVSVGNSRDLFFKSFWAREKCKQEFFRVMCVCNLSETKTESMMFVFGPLFFDRITEEADRSAHRRARMLACASFKTFTWLTTKRPRTSADGVHGAQEIEKGLGELKLDYFYSHLVRLCTLKQRDLFIR